MSGWIDLHCHLIPYVDDGAEDLDEALSLVESAARQGITISVLTPHRRSGMFESEDETIAAQFARLQQESRKLEQAPELLLGREYYADRHFFRQMEEGMPLQTLGSSRAVLIEFSSRGSFEQMKEQVAQLCALGYHPVVAHVERYACIHEDPDQVAELSRLGAWIQVNADSIIGKEGFLQKRFCKKLIQADLVDVAASDAHSMSERCIRIAACAEYLHKKMGGAYAEKLLRTNPERILHDGRNEKNGSPAGHAGAQGTALRNCGGD